MHKLFSSRRFSVIRSFIAMAFALLAASCGSLEKNAQGKLEEGDFDAALPMYERLIKSDGDNPEIQSGFKRAREGYLGNRLIEVRRSRSAGNMDQALEQLRNIVSLEAAWKTSPTAAARFTQEEEVGYAWRPFVARVSSAILAKQPLRAEYEWKRFVTIFSDAKYAKGTRDLGVDVVSNGKVQCSKFARDAKSDLPYYSAFVSRFCRHFKSPTVVLVNENARLSELYSGVEWDGSISGLPADFLPFMKASWNEALVASPWFDAKGKRKIGVKAQGSYLYDARKTLVSRVHEYSETEKYDTVENVTKTRQVPFTTERWETDPTDGILKRKPFTEMRTESYEEPVKVTKSREVKKQFPYNALYHEMKIELAKSFEARLGDESCYYSDKTKGSAQGDEQTIKRDDIGLKPSLAPNLDPADWMKSDSKAMSVKLKELLSGEWKSIQCSGTGEGSTLASTGNYVLRCARDPAQAQSSVINEWYRTSVGLGVSETEGLFAQR